MKTFADLINADKPVLVDFSAEWCGPCKMMAPILKDVASEIGDTASIIKVDIDKNQAAANKYGIQSVPTLILFKKGEIKWRQSGVIPANNLVKLIKANV